MRVTGDDYTRLAERADQLVSFDGVQAHMLMLDGHCAALELDPLTAQLTCTTYETRPQVCRDLARGSGQCLAERDSKAERPLLALGRARLLP